MKTWFKNKYGEQEKHVSFRSAVTKELYFDVTRGDELLFDKMNELRAIEESKSG